MERITLEQLLALEWDSRTLATYESLKTRGEVWDESGDAIAERYLRISHQIDRNPRPVRDLEIAVDPFAEQRSTRRPVTINSLVNNQKTNNEFIGDYSRAIDSFLLAVLHPDQLPMTREDIEGELYGSGVLASYRTLLTWLNRLIDKGLIRKLPNPYKGNRFIYCNAEFCETPQVGDRVIELMRRRGSRIGTVVRFRRYRDGNRYPVVLWEFSVRSNKPLACQFESFANPSSLVVIERPNQNLITRRSAS